MKCCENGRRRRGGCLSFFLRSSSHRGRLARGAERPWLGQPCTVPPSALNEGETTIYNSLVCRLCVGARRVRGAAVHFANVRRIGVRWGTRCGGFGSGAGEQRVRCTSTSDGMPCRPGVFTGCRLSALSGCALSRTSFDVRVYDFRPSIRRRVRCVHGRLSACAPSRGSGQARHGY
jgi:hypothetical protein